jgi:hypothetical protein
MAEIRIKREVEIIVSDQAQAVLSYTDFTIEQFVDHMANVQKFSLGGHNAVTFLEDMKRKGVK